MLGRFRDHQPVGRAHAVSDFMQGTPVAQGAFSAWTWDRSMTLRSAGPISVGMYSSFALLPGRFYELAARAASKSFSISHPWFENFERTVAAHDGECRLYAAASAAGQPLALMPMWWRRQSTPMKPNDCGALANYYTSLYHPWLAEDTAAAHDGLRHIVDLICRQRPRWDTVSLSPMLGDAAELSVLAEAFATHGMYTTRLEAAANWYADVRGMDFDTYMAHRPLQLRNTIARRQRRLERVHRSAFRMITQAEQLERAIEDYDVLYSKRWGRSEPYPDFIPGLMRASAENKWLRLGFLDIDGKPAATQFWIVCGGVASIYKLAFDPDFSEFSVGTLLSSWMMEQAIQQDRVEFIDYLTGDDAYKADWMTERRVFSALYVCNTRTARGLALGARNIGGRLLRRAGVASAVHRYANPDQGHA